MTPFDLVRLLSLFALTAKARRHFIECAAYDMIDRRLRPWLPRMTFKHVLGLRPLPSMDRRHGVLLDPAREGV